MVHTDCLGRDSNEIVAPGTYMYVHGVYCNTWSYVHQFLTPCHRRREPGFTGPLLAWEIVRFCSSPDVWTITHFIRQFSHAIPGLYATPPE